MKGIIFITSIIMSSRKIPTIIMSNRKIQSMATSAQRDKVSTGLRAEMIEFFLECRYITQSITKLFLYESCVVFLRNIFFHNNSNMIVPFYSICRQSSCISTWPSFRNIQSWELICINSMQVTLYINA